MSFSPFRIVSRLTQNPELAVLAVLDEALKQAICALLSQHPDIEEGELRSELAANTIIHRAWDLRDMIRGYRAALMRERRRRDIPF
jgi:hypothetical protein